MPGMTVLPQQPTFMDQFAPYMDNIMRSIMMGVQNRREDESTARGYLEEGYQETIPMTPSQETAAPQSPEERAAFQGGPRGQFWQQRVPDVTVGGRGLMGMPKRGFRKPVEPKMSYKITRDETTGKPLLKLFKGGNLYSVKPMTENQAKLQDKKKIVVKKDASGKEQVYAQAYDYDPGSGKRTLVDDPYRTKVGGDTNIEVKMSSASERENLARGAATLESLDNLQTLFNKSYVGPVVGRIGKVADMFGLNKQTQSDFYAATASFTNQVIKEITGAQMGEKEATRIMKEIPRPNDPPSVLQAKWKQSKRNVAMLRKKRLEIMRKSGIRTPDMPTKKTQPKKKIDPFGWR